MKKKTIAVLAFAATGLCGAFDNTISNGFWCTWGYRNAATNAISGTAAVFLAPSEPDVAHSAMPARFSTYPPGCIISIR